ncbi:YadA-like family protein [Acidaminococcus fermentans DSM 20731]|uniref:YadA domain protein n=2 Tax=Acidaminococcus fermentans TaxID=905 RepID=D2RMW6_ACIFV|nr:ESPR-type extended signal peptide-containing protein [Acidaminococcus fermentans]ADB48384.1 YadA domain protein [Acidaminococcus fermentans DSM 20731]UEA73046.1 YadA-like family protein [Acidaminococcus fermentans DSM 20731]
MNKIYKVIWSRVRHCYVVVSELAKRAGKEKSSHPGLAAHLAAGALCVCLLTLGGHGTPAEAAGQPAVSAATQNQYVAFLVTVDSGSVKGNDNGQDTNTFNGATYHKVTLSDGRTKYWVREGYTLTEGTNGKYTTLSRSDKKFDVAFTGSGNQPADILSNTTSAVSSTGVSTNVGESLNKVSASAFEGLSQAGGTQVPGNWDYIIYEPSWEGHTQANTANRTYYKDGYADMYNPSAGTNGNPRGFVSVGNDLVWNGTLNQYTYKGKAVDTSHLYVIGGKIGVFTSYDGSKVYEGTVYGANNEILMTAIKDGKYYSYWAAPVTDPSATMGTYRVSDYNKDLDVLKSNDVALYHNDIKSVDMAKRGTNAAPAATITAMRNGNGTPEAVDGAITVTGGGGTNGQDTTVTLSNTTNGATVSQVFTTGSKVVVNTAATGSSELKSLTINGQEYATALKFGGDNHGTTTLTRNLSEELDILGGATGTLTDNNIGVNASDGTLKVQLAKDVDLTVAGSLTVGNTRVDTNGVTVAHTGSTLQMGYQSFTYDYMKPVTENGTLKLESARANAKGLFVTGLSNRTWTPGNYVTGRAATEDQLEQAGRHFLSIKTATTDEDGNPITPAEENTLANYYNDGATGSASMAFGVETKASGDQSLAMGAKSSASGMNSLAIGYGNEAAGTQSVAVGNSTNASGNFSVAMGLGAQAGTKNDDVESTDHGAAVAVGYGAEAAETGSAAYGYSAMAGGVESSAFGTSANAAAEGGVALGAHSIANRGSGEQGYLIPDEVKNILIKDDGDKGNTSADTDIDTTTWVATSGAVSVGGTDATGVKITRQITNVAAGSQNSDAVNVAQLKALASQGMNFQGNDTSTSVHLDQGGTLQIQGSGRKKDEEYSTQNVKVLTDTANKRLSIALDKNPTFDSVMAGTENGTSGGQAGSIKIVGADSSNANKATTITAGYAALPELAGTNGTGRISYTDGDGTAHTVATLGDGLKLAGDAGTGSVALDNTLTVSGGATNLAAGSNIGVTANGSTLSLKLAKDITGLDTVTAGGAKLGKQTDGNDTTRSGDYLTGLDNTTWTVGQTNYVSGRAATEDQLKSVSDVVNANKTNIANNTETIGRGLNFQANTKGTDDSYKTVNRALGSTVAVRAHDAQDGHTYKTDNLTTEIDDNGIITVKMDTQLTADKVTVGKDNNAITINGADGSLTTGSSTLSGTGLTINNGPSVTTSGISGGSKQITEVKSGASRYDDSNNPVYGTDTNAANIGDVKNIAAKIVTVSGDGTNTKVDKTTAADGTVDYKVSLNDSVTLGSDAAKKIALDGTAGTVMVGDKVTLNGNTGTAAIGGATLGKSGADTYLTGLTNKTWDGTAVSGRAATEDQLKSVSDTVNAGWNAKVGDQTLAVTPANNTFTFAAGDNIALTPTDSSKTITIATQPNVTFTTVRVGSTDGTDGIYIGSQPGGGANGSATSNITSITGLKNTAWVTDHFMSGRAATEDQLNEVAKTIKGEASASDIYVESGSVSYGNNGEGTGTLVRKNDKTTGQLTGLHDYYVTGGSVSTDGKTLNLTKNGGAAIPGIDLTNVLNQDSHLVTADSGEYTVGSDGKVTLKVKNNVAGSTPTDVVISGIASNAALRQGLNFKANAAEKTDGSDTYNAQLGGTVRVLGGAAKEKHTYNTDNITTTMDNGTITVKLDNDLTANSLTAGSSTVDGTVRVTGATGAYVEMDGSDGSIHLGNNGGRYSALYQNYGGKGFLTAETSPRLEYAVDNDLNTRHTIATLDDGMKFAGDDAKTDSTKVVSRTLNSTLNITGGAATGNLTDGNIGVVKNDAGDGLTIKLNKDLTNMGTISFAPTETGKQGIKIGSQNVGTSGKGTNAQTGDYITGLTNTKWNADDIVSGRAATEDQLQNVAKSIVNGSATGGGFGLSADNADSTNATEVKQDLGSSIKITTGGDINLSTQADSANKAIVVSLNKELNLTKTTLTDGITGATTVVDGNGVVITPKQGSDADKVKLTTDGLSNGGKQITNVQSGLDGTTFENAAGDVLNHAATIGDLKTVSNGVKTDLTATGLNFKGNNEDTTVHRNLGDTLIIQGTGANGRDYDGGANVQVLANKDTGTLTVQLDRDLNAHTMTLGKAGAPGVDGETGILKINGQNKDGSISPVSIKATYADTTQDNTTTLKTAMSRITYDGGNGHSHTVATLEDGLQLSGDNGETANTTLNKKVTIKGGVTKDNLVDNSTDPTKNNNIGVIASQDSGGNTTLSLQLAKDITGLHTVEAGTVVMGNQTVVNSNQTNETGNYVTGLSNKDWNGTYVSGRAATEDQLKKVNDSITRVLGSGTFAITAGGRGEAVDATIEQNLGSAIRIFGDAPVTNEQNDGSGDFWDRSKANILTKVKKDHNNEDYVSVELQDHLEVGVHGDGKTIEGTDGSMQFKGKSAKEVNITGDTGIALSDNGNQAAALRQADGAGYLDLTGTTAGTRAAVSVYTGAKNLAQQDQTRLTYTDQSNTPHDVATMDDGLIFAGDTEDNISRTLNGTLKIYGGVTDKDSLSTGSNIGVVASSDGLQLKLAKDLTGIDSLTGLTNTTLDVAGFGASHRAATEEQLVLMKGSIINSQQGGGFGLTADKANTSGKSDVKQNLGSTIGIHGDGNITTAVSEDGKSIDIKLNNQVDLGTEGSLKAGGVTINKDGIDVGGKNIIKVHSGIVKGDDSDNTNAANIGDVKKLAGDAAKRAVDSLGTRDFTGDDGEKISKKLGESMKLSGGADTTKLTDKNIGVVKNANGEGLDIRLSKELNGLTSVTTGSSTLNNEGLTVHSSTGSAGTTVTSSGIKIASDGEGTHAVEVSNGNVSMGGQQIHDVAPGTKPTDAVNVSQLGGVVSGVSNAITRLDSRVDRVGAGASALAALHPLEFDPEDKLNFAAGFGHYRSANAAAIGAFYQPTESVRFNVGGSFGGGENMVNAGVTFSLDPQRRDRFQSRIVLMRTVQQLRSDNDALRQDNQKVHAQLDAMNDRLNQLTALVEQLSARK